MPATPPMTSFTHGPAAFTKTRALKWVTLPAAPFLVSIDQCPFSRRAVMQAVRVSIPSPLLAGIERIQNDEAGIVDPTIGIIRRPCGNRP